MEYLLFYNVKYPKSTSMKYIGEKIRSIRTLKGYSQENMAEMLDVSLPTYAEIERGKRDVTISRLEQIAEKLGVTLNDVLAFEERMGNYLNTNTHRNTSESISTAQISNYDNRELQHQIEKLQLELQLLKAQKEKAEVEAIYWKQLTEKG